MYGFAKPLKANCGWFEADEPDGFHLLHYQEDNGDWVNSECLADDSKPLDDLKLISNKNHICEIGDLSLEEQCDKYVASYLGGGTLS